MTQSTKIAPVDETDDLQPENPPEKESTSKIKHHILIVFVILITISCVALTITLSIVLKDSSDDSDFETTSSATTIPVSPPPDSDNAVLVLSPPEGSLPFVVNFKGK